MWLSGKRFENSANQIFIEKGAIQIDDNPKHFTKYQLNNLEITVPFTQVNTFTVFFKFCDDRILNNLEAFTPDNNEYNFHQPRNCSVEFAIEKLKKHIEPLGI